MLIAILLSALAQTPGAETTALTLAAARARALAANPTLRAQRAEARAAAAGPWEASRAFLPTITADAQALRSTDPVAVFGMKLRQGGFSAGDLALGALNQPAAYSDYTARLSVEQPIVSLDGWYGHAAVGRAAAAQAAAARRAAGATTVEVIRAYWDAQLAAGRVAALDTGLLAARAHAEQAEAMHAQGLVSGLDARLARLRAARVEAQRLAAAADADNALAALRAVLALPDSTALRLVDPLTVVALPDSTSDGAAFETRGDLAALDQGMQAAQLGVRRAWAANLPSLALFGTLAQHSHVGLGNGGSGDWTIGIGLQWRLFAGLSGAGAVARARAERDAVSARREAALRQARFEVAQSQRLHAAALLRMRVARAARAEAAEAMEQAALRYRTGTTPVTELLDVQAALTDADLDLLSARHDVLVTAALYDFANGVFDR
jgi:outer membrane protein TolC